MNLNVEWYSTDSHLSLFAGFIGLLAVLFSASRRTESFSLFHCLAVSLFVLLALSFRRYIPFAAIVLLVPAAAVCSTWRLRISESLAQAVRSLTVRDRERTHGAWTVTFCSLLLCAVLLFRPEVPQWAPERLGMTAVHPEDVAQFLLDAQRERPDDFKVFHSPDLGGFFAFSWYPHARVWIDDRNVLNGRAQYEKFFAVRDALAAWREIIAAEAFSHIVVRRGAPIGTRLHSGRENWVEVFSSDDFLVFARNSIAG